MKKISALFSRDPSNPRILTDDYHPAAAWVVAGEGVATRKWDGTAVLVRGGVLFARHDVKRGKAPPPGFEPAQDPDPNTGHHPGWVPTTRREDAWIRLAAFTTAESIEKSASVPERTDFFHRSPHHTNNGGRLCRCSTCLLLWIEDGTYEACGPKIGGNPERLTEHRLIRHGRDLLVDVPRDKEGLVRFFSTHDVEGVVWWRDLGDPDCDKIKITASALGVQRPR